MKNKIMFIPPLENLNSLAALEKPKPAKNFLPIWWKKGNLTLKDENNNELVPKQLSFKGCMPFLDSLLCGYMLSTYQDIYVSNQNGRISLNWKVGPDPAIYRDIPEAGLPIPAGCSKTHFAWRINFGIIVPKNYSILFTHPLNRHDLPFTSSSAIVDEGVHWPGVFSFWIKENFEGLIPQGTPIAQLIPFKRENWISELRSDLSNEAEKRVHEKNKHFFGFYKNFIRQEKKFE